MKYIRKYNLLGQQVQTEIDAFQNTWKVNNPCWEEWWCLVMLFKMGTQNVGSRQEFSAFLRRTGIRVGCILQCLLQKHLGKLSFGLWPWSSVLNLFLFLVYQSQIYRHMGSMLDERRKIPFSKIDRDMNN